VAYLVPHGTLRMMAVGLDDRPATRPEAARMRELLAAGLRDGAGRDVQSASTYTPGMYASTGELVDLCRVVAAHGGYHSPHHRSYGAGALDAYREMIEVGAAGRLSGAPHPRHD